MKIDDLVLLIKAGYSKMDIEQLGIAMNPIEQPTEIDGQTAIEEVKEQEAPKEASVSDDRFKALETKIDYAINRLNYISVQNSAQPETETESLDDILKSIIK